MCLIDDMIFDDAKRSWLRKFTRITAAYIKGKSINTTSYKLDVMHLYDTVEGGDNLGGHTTLCNFINTAAWISCDDRDGIGGLSVDLDLTQPSTKEALKSVMKFITPKLKQYDRAIVAEKTRGEAALFYLRHGRNALVDALKSVPMPRPQDGTPLFPEHSDTWTWPLITAWLRGENDHYDNHAPTLLRRARYRMDA